MENAKIKSLLIGGVMRCPLLKHYGASTYLPEKVLPLKNYSWIKPEKGGLWTSPIDSKWGWKDWNEGELFRKCNEQNSFTIELNKDAKIFIINSLEDLKKAPLINGFSKKVIDFEYIAKKYDAIWLTEKGQYETHLNYKLDLYGWDCETVLIINPNCCTATA